MRAIHRSFELGAGYARGAVLALVVVTALGADASGQPVVRDHRTHGGGSPTPFTPSPAGRPPRVPPRGEAGGGLATLPADVGACSDADRAEFAEITGHFRGMRGSNPVVPSSYGLIGAGKFAEGSGIDRAANPFLGDNWFPIRIEKQTLCGKFVEFGITNIGKESDWNIHVVPDVGFESFIGDALPYNDPGLFYGWNRTPDGQYTIEYEVTPAEAMGGNPWFTNATSKSELLNKEICAYGPFVREDVHGNPPEIHPTEQMWWTENNGDLMVMLVGDASGRFNDAPPGFPRKVGNLTVSHAGDYDARKAQPDYHPWTQDKNQRAHLEIPLEVDPSRGVMNVYLESQADEQYYAGASFADAPEKTLSYRGAPAVKVDVPASIDPFLGVTFGRTCANPDGKLLGRLLIDTAIGNGDGKEGFIVLQVRKSYEPIDRLLLAGDAFNNWKPVTRYDASHPFSDVIVSDREGRGIVDGIIDFNGNGKADLFTRASDGGWWVLFDGKGAWTRLESSPHVVQADLRFGDFNGDKKTDVIHVGSGTIQVSYSGTGKWTPLSDADGARDVRVGDFNGDGRTDVVTMVIYPDPSARFGQVLPPWGNMKVKFGGKGDWKMLNERYHFTSADDYAKNFRFGHFNADTITDVFRYFDGKFGVYWAGRGDIVTINAHPNLPPKTSGLELRFAKNFTSGGMTDVLFAPAPGFAWTIFRDGGKNATAPLAMKYALSRVQFGDIDDDNTAEPFVEDLGPAVAAPVVARRAPPTIAPWLRTRYVPGSLKRTSTGLTMQVSVRHVPGRVGGAVARTTGAAPTLEARVNGKALVFHPEASTALPPGTLARTMGEAKVLGTLEGVPLRGPEETAISMTLGATAQVATTPGYAIVAQPTEIEETEGPTAEFRAWKAFLSPPKPGRQSLVDAPPTPPIAITRVAFELRPLYASNEEGKANLSAVDDPQLEMNGIAYGGDEAAIGRLFGAKKVFSIKWKFELQDVTTGKVMPVANAGALATNGKWPKSKVAFTFPASADLLRFTATATVTDVLGNKTAQPFTTTFWNQRIPVTAPEQLAAWLKAIDRASAEYKFLMTRAAYFADDQKLTPAEVAKIVK